MYCIIKCIVQGKQARVKNAYLRHPSCTVVRDVKTQICVTRPQCVKLEVTASLYVADLTVQHIARAH